MAHFSVTVPDSKVTFFKELLQNLNFTAKQTDEIIIPEEHKNIVRERIKASEADPSRLMGWDKVKHNIKF